MQDRISPSAFDERVTVLEACDFPATPGTGFGSDIKNNKNTAIDAGHAGAAQMPRYAGHGSATRQEETSNDHRQKDAAFG